MKVTAHRIAKFSTDAIVIGFAKPCVISLYKSHVARLMTAGLAIAEILESVYASERDNTEAVVYRYASHSEADELNKNLHPRDYNYQDGHTYNDFYVYYSTLDLSYLTRDQHKALYRAIAEINDGTCDYNSDEEENIYNYDNTDRLSVDLEACTVQYVNGKEVDYDFKEVLTSK
ncbi:hypothetical protein [Acinetobacter baumannii]|uniref:hypothetical protein n=1 Tax=Acinetobacter baumannii TaxID=470 RepID=UPI0009234826|nr:hypothetical protein [Acinetobacter baumannii]MCA4235215.1 hypothetical protein [Acinetobacter baumannii]MCA4259146.1 hypothetical protein [Acinetobacter baumannii]MCA4273604.1 hypothetical protein [Acinetobacter baumannii]MDV4249779.1 hypothetical protein [Acinetobacter baumannii]MDV4288956.1 hypothetical protein [Acinetobacter baumannii]